MDAHQRRCETLGIPDVGQQASSAVDHEIGSLADVGDAEGLAAWMVRIHDDAGLRERLREAGRLTAAENSYARLAPRWEALLEGFAERDG